MAGAIGIEMDRVAAPNRVSRGPRTFGDGFGVIALQIKDVELVGLAPAVPLLGTEIAGLRRVNHAVAVGREVSRARFGHRQRFRWATVNRHRVEAGDGKRPRVSLRLEDE